MPEEIVGRCIRCNKSAETLVQRGWMMICEACQLPDEWTRQARKDLEDFGEPKEPTDAA